MESEGNIFCWKCGALNLEKHNFCVKCGHSLYSETKKPESKFEKNKPRRKNDYLKNNGVGMKKKLLIGLGVLIAVIVIVNVEINNDSGTFDTSQSLIINESKNLGNVLVEIEKIEFHDTYATVFLSVENLGSDEAHVYETDAYVIQGQTQFKTKIPKPFGASGTWIEGYNIPSQVIREGVIFLDIWKANEPFEFVLDGSYIKQDQFGGLIKDMTFVFNFEPKESVSKCGAGTVFDETTNSCIVK